MSSLTTVAQLSDADQALYQQALQARTRAHAPYSEFAVGCALITASGESFVGCNVENAAYGSTMCAERVAIYSSVVNAVQTAQIQTLVVVAQYPEPVPPCGACRQVMAEFATQARIILTNTQGAAHVWTFAQLLPGAFNLPTN